MIKHLLFDLDGTLLPIDIDFFFVNYLSALSRKFTDHVPEQEFKKKLMASTTRMIENQDPHRTNEEIFWSDFPKRLGYSRSFLEPIFINFYNNEYRDLKTHIPPTIPIREILESARQNKFKITIATNPIFPHYALLERLAWINCRDLPYEMVTSMEDMHFCKPNPLYYREILDLLGARADECLMIGNDVEEDLVAATLGIKTCLVTDRVINKKRKEVAPDYTCELSGLKTILSQLNK